MVRRVESGKPASRFFLDWRRIGKRLIHPWSFVLDLLTVLNRNRFSAILTLAACAGLLIPQGQEIILVTSSAGVFWQLAFLLAVLIWGTSAWYWARILCGSEFTRSAVTITPSSLNAFVEYAPRTIGSIAVLAPGIGYLKLGDFGSAAIYAVAAVLFYVAVRIRRRIWRGLDQRPQANLKFGVDRLSMTTRWWWSASIMISIIMLVLASAAQLRSTYANCASTQRKRAALVRLGWISNHRRDARWRVRVEAQV